MGVFMKAVLAILILGSIQMVSFSAQASVKCEMHLNDLSVKPIIVTGENKNDVIAKGADRCFEMYNERTLSRTGHGLQDDEAGVTVANTCTNICG